MLTSQSLSIDLSHSECQRLPTVFGPRRQRHINVESLWVGDKINTSPMSSSPVMRSQSKTWRTRVFVATSSAVIWKSFSSSVILKILYHVHCNLNSECFIEDRIDRPLHNFSFQNLHKRNATQNQNEFVDTLFISSCGRRKTLTKASLSPIKSILGRSWEILLIADKGKLI